VAISKLFGKEVLMGNSAVTQSAPSFKGGKNSEPNQRVENTENANNPTENKMVIFL
jgi:hypothetical protein